MSHVDDGALHAYLDGALDALPAAEAARIRGHLASCASCARRLEEERALREEAGAILAGADPGVGALPNLEELRRRAAIRSGVRSGSRLRHLSWAASLVLAVGAGWLLRGSQAPRVSEAPRPAPPRVELAEIVEPEAAEPSAAEAGLDTPRPTLAAGRAQGGAVLADSAASPRRATAPAPALARSLPEAAEPRAAEAGPEAPRPTPGAAYAGAVREAAPPSRRADLAAKLSAPSLAAKVSAPSLAVVADAGASTTALAVPDLPVLWMGAAGPGFPAGTLRVLQSLDGDTLELLHLPAGADPSTLVGPGDPERTQVAVRYGAGWLVGRAHASVEALEGLLERVTGGR